MLVPAAVSRPLMAIAVALVTAGAFLLAGTTSASRRSSRRRSCSPSAPRSASSAPATSAASGSSSAKYGLMFGLVQMFASLGSAVGQPVISALLKEMSWSQLLAGFGSFGVLLTVAFVFLVRNPVSTPEEAAAAAAEHKGNVLGEIVRDLRTCLTNRQVLLAAAFAGASFGTMLAVGVLRGPRVQEARGADGGLRGGAVGARLARPRVRRAARQRHLRPLEKPQVAGRDRHAAAGGRVVALFIYGPANGTGASMVDARRRRLRRHPHARLHDRGRVGSAGADRQRLRDRQRHLLHRRRRAAGGPGLGRCRRRPTSTTTARCCGSCPAVLLLGALAALALRESKPAA